MSLARLTCVSLFCVIIAGCSNHPPIAQVSGVLTFQGDPVPGVLITFQPDGGRPSWGLTDRAGRFTLNYSKSIPTGALIGKHTVWLTRDSGMPAKDLSPVEYAAQLEGQKTEPADVGGIPSKYFSEKETTIKIELTGNVDDLKINLE